MPLCGTYPASRQSSYRHQGSKQALVRILYPLTNLGSLSVGFPDEMAEIRFCGSAR